MPRRAGAYTFAALFAVESFVRALNSTVVSLQAYDILGAAQKVSVLSTAVSRHRADHHADAAASCWAACAGAGPIRSAPA